MINRDIFVSGLPYLTQVRGEGGGGERQNMVALMLL